jgi:hypothetical protein
MMVCGRENCHRELRLGMNFRTNLYLNVSYSYLDFRDFPAVPSQKDNVKMYILWMMRKLVPSHKLIKLL